MLNERGIVFRIVKKLFVIGSRDLGERGIRVKGGRRRDVKFLNLRKRIMKCS